MNLTAEQRAEIIAEDAAVPVTVLALKYGCSDSTIRAIRKASGVPLIRKKYERRAPKESAKEPIEPEEEAQDTFAVTMEFTEAQVDAIWAKFPLAVKAEALYSAFLIQGQEE